MNCGFPAHTDKEYIGAVIPLMKTAKVSALLIPGIGTIDHLRMAHELGVHTIRVATHCTEADVSEQHIGLARKLGLDTVGFLMMAHMYSPEGLLREALLMESYGANCIYIADSAGYMLPDDVKARLAPVRAALAELARALDAEARAELPAGSSEDTAATEALTRFGVLSDDERRRLRRRALREVVGPCVAALLVEGETDRDRS